MSKTKNVGIFSILAFGIMMLLIPATSIASAQEYDRYYEEKDRHSNDYGYENDRYYEDYRQTSYDDPYKKNDKDSNKPVIIIENKVPVKKKVMKEPPMVLVNKEVLFCDVIANGTDSICFDPSPPDFPGPNSDRYVQECTSEQCEDINTEIFDLTLTSDVEFPASEEGTKLNIKGERYTVVEENIIPGGPFPFFCQQSGFDTATEHIVDGLFVGSCMIAEGDCSGFVQEGELKECTIKNYVVSIED